MSADELVIHCFNEHVKDIGGRVLFTFDEYRAFWLSHSVGDRYSMRNRDGSIIDCSVAYYPIPYYKDLRALIEISNGAYIDFREVPIRFLIQNKKAGLSTGPT